MLTAGTEITDGGWSGWVVAGYLYYRSVLYYQIVYPDTGKTYEIHHSSAEFYDEGEEAA